MVSLPEFMASPQPSLHTDQDIQFYQLGMPGHAFANRARRAANLPAQQEAVRGANELSLQAFLSEQARETYGQRLDLAATARDSLATPATTLEALMASAPGTEAETIAAMFNPDAAAAADQAIQAGRVADATGGSGSGGQPKFSVDPSFFGPEISANGVTIDMLPQVIEAIRSNSGGVLGAANNPTSPGGQVIDGTDIAQGTTIPSGADQGANNAAEQNRADTGGERVALPQSITVDGRQIPAVVNQLPNGVYRYVWTDPETGEQMSYDAPGQ